MPYFLCSFVKYPTQHQITHHVSAMAHSLHFLSKIWMRMKLTKTYLVLLIHFSESSEILWRLVTYLMLLNDFNDEFDNWLFEVGVKLIDHF